ncbi:MAG TPA: ribonuclease J [bacterium]|jgi:ribonuclease J|nr:ribonuclease J [Dictyoglomota bacterium]HHV80342.1 ribonuclease J [bacterium]HOK29994.1 ribonuclease J [bacterium]HOL55190.1 ribonuclease J [bacterium]HOP56146.1 ribonuclease J [bacterium]
MSEKLKLIPLGGLGEIGKNMLVVEYGEVIAIIDTGLMFPTDEMPGVDYVIPDISYIEANKNKVKGIILTHCHEDHVGALPYVLKTVRVPIIGTRLTLGMIMSRLKDFGLSNDVKLVEVQERSRIGIGPLSFDFFVVNHSVPGNLGVAIRSPVGIIVHTGDFKFDYTPIDGKYTDFSTLASLGEEGVKFLLSDSTNAERPGYTPSERIVGDTLDSIVRGATGRVFITTFASNVHRIQQVFNIAYKYKRFVAVIGKSMNNTVSVASRLGYLDIPPNTLIKDQSLSNFKKNQLIILTSGSQGEPMSALTRLAFQEYKSITIGSGDTVVIAATPVPGNEKMVARTINALFSRGAEVIYTTTPGVHVSGHGSMEELKLMYTLLRPEYFVPVHGEIRHQVAHSKIISSLGLSEDHIFRLKNGDILEIDQDGARVSGQIQSGMTMVDGLELGEGGVVLRDRQRLAQDGIVVLVVTIDKENEEIVSIPEVIMRGVTYKDEDSFVEELKTEILRALVTSHTPVVSNDIIRDVVGRFIYERTRRRPVIIPVLVEV